MKGLILSLMFVLCCNLMVAQNKFNAELGYRRIVSTKVSAPDSYKTNNNGTDGNSIRLLLGYHINNQININAGLGLDGYVGDFSTNTMPIVLNIQYSIKDQPQGLFVMLEGGPQLALSESLDKGHMFLGAIGYRFKLSNLLRLKITGGYNYQKTTEGFDPLLDNNITRQGFCIGASISL